MRTPTRLQSNTFCSCHQDSLLVVGGLKTTLHTSLFLSLRHAQTKLAKTCSTQVANWQICSRFCFSHSSCWRGSAAAAGWQRDRDLRKVTKPLLSNAYVAFFDQGNASACLPDSHTPQAGKTCSAERGWQGVGWPICPLSPLLLAKPPLSCWLARSHHSLVANTCCILGPASCMTVTRSHQVLLPNTCFACVVGPT